MDNFNGKVSVSKSFGRPDRWYYSLAQWVVIIALIQLVIGVLVVRAQSRQATTADSLIQLAVQETDLQRQVDRLDGENMPSRIAVLEHEVNSIKDGIGEVRHLIYGSLGAIAASLIAQVLQIKGLKRGRG